MEVAVGIRVLAPVERFRGERDSLAFSSFVGGGT